MPALFHEFDLSPQGPARIFKKQQFKGSSLLLENAKNYPPRTIFQNSETFVCLHSHQKMEKSLLIKNMEAVSIQMCLIEYETLLKVQSPENWLVL